MDDLIALRIKVTGGKEGASEVKALNREVAKTGPVSKQAATMATQSSRTTSAAFKKQAAMMQATGRTMTYGLTLPLAAVGAMAVKTAANFDKSMAQVKTATGLGGAGMTQMESLALKWGAETVFSANESAEAMLELTKSGITPAQIKAGALGATMNLAATEGLALGRTGEIVGAAMNTFHLKGSEAVRISDALAGGALASSASVGGLSQSLAQGGQSASMYGLSVEETVGALAAFAQNGIQASDAGTSFKTFLMRLNPTTKKAREEMANLGLDFFDSRGRMKDLGAVATELRTHLGGMTDEQRNAALATLFGSDAIRAANIVYSEGPEGIERYVRATQKKGSAERMAQAQMQGLSGSLENLQGSLETAAVHLGHALAPAIELTAGAIGGLADQFAGLPPEVQTTIALIGTVAAMAGPLLYLAGSAAKAVIAIRELRTAEALGGGGMLGGKGKLLGRLGIAGAGIGASQLAGGAVGGDLGNWVGNVGTGAAAGFAVGGPMGAAVGATAGGVLAAVQKLTSSEKQLTFQQQRLAESSKSVKEWWERQRGASRGLIAADERVRGAHRRARSATQEMRQAQRHLGAVVSEYGSKSRPAIHAEAVLTGKIHAHRRAIKQLQNAERLRGVALSAYKTATNVTILAERHRINVLTQLRDRQARLYTASKQANPQSERTRELAQRLLGTEGKLSEATKKHAQTLSDAAAKGGRGYAKFLATANQESIRAGGQMKALTEKANRLAEAFTRLGEQQVTLPAMPGTPAPIEPLPEAAGPPRPGRGGGGGGRRGAGLSLPSGVGDLPRARFTASPATRRLLAPIPDPQPSTRAATLYRANEGGGTRPLHATIKIGKKVVAEAVTEARDDAEARL
ncbi:MAG TPA: phage tail tape measure protein [Solirubrobacterales bacterium]|nr:phage tail tape measure protein [Solirubrobacterales bacterium]